MLNKSLDLTASRAAAEKNENNINGSDNNNGDASGTLGLARSMSGILSTYNREDNDYDLVCNITEQLANTFSVWEIGNNENEEEDDDDGTVHMSNPNVDDQFIERMNEFVVEPLRAGTLNGTEAKALLTTMCAQQSELKGNSMYIDILKNGGTTMENVDDGAGAGAGEDGLGKGRRVAFVSLPRRSQAISNLLGGRGREDSSSNDEVLKVLGDIQSRLDKMDGSSRLNKIGSKKKKTDEREGNGPCSVGDGCMMM